MNMVRCMLFGMRVPLRFWPEAVQYAVHILNRSPTAILGDMTPIEKWSKHKPSVEHLRVFGCVAFALIPYERRVKLDEKSIKCVMFGVSKESKAYRLYDPSTEKIIISRDVRFDEKKSWSWDEKVEDDKFVEVFDEEEKEKFVIPGEEALENSQETGEGEEIVNEQEVETRATESQSEITRPTATAAENGGGAAVRKSGAGRTLQNPVWMKDYECKDMGLFILVDGEELVAFYVAEDDPQTFEDAIKEDIWRKAMEAEINSIEENHTWELVELPEGIGIQYKRGFGAEDKLVGYVDSDYARDEDDRRSTSGYVFMFGNGAVSWSSKEQPIVTLSTMEAEFVAAANGACQAMWLRNVLVEIGFDQGNGTTLFCDNSSTIKLSKNPVLHGRSKHIHVKYHFLRDLVNEGVIELEYCRTEEQLADIMTKPVKLEVFEKLRGLMGVGLKEV